MSLWTCIACAARRAVGMVTCPQCGAAAHDEGDTISGPDGGQGQRHIPEAYVNTMPQISGPGANDPIGVPLPGPGANDPMGVTLPGSGPVIAPASPSVDASHTPAEAVAEEPPPAEAPAAAP